MGRRHRNPREIPPWVIQLALYGAGGFLLYKFGKKLLDSIKEKAKDATKPLAKAIVGESTIKPADGITYTLPNGSRIPAAMTVADGKYFYYVGKRYKLVAADPPGSGNYKAESA